MIFWEKNLNQKHFHNLNLKAIPFDHTTLGIVLVLQYFILIDFGLSIPKVMKKELILPVHMPYTKTA